MFSNSYTAKALFIAFIWVIPPSANIKSGNSPNPPLGLSIECFILLVTTSSVHLGSSCPNTFFILNLLDIFFFIIPACATHIPATIFVPEIFEISKVSILYGNFSKFKTSFNSLKISNLSFDLFSSVISAFFCAISTNLSFSPFCGAFISTFLPASLLNHSSIICLSSISSCNIILFGNSNLPI